MRVRFPDLYRIASYKDASVKDLLSYHNITLHWDVCFFWEAQDWELESITEFIALLYSVKIGSDEHDVLCWNPSSRDIFEVKSFYNVLHTGAAHHFPWKICLEIQNTSKVSFFLWTAALGKVLTMDNLRKRRLIVLDWCCMCKRVGETNDHLLLHCPMARELLDLAFSLFGVHWVMPSSVMGLLFCWL